MALYLLDTDICSYVIRNRPEAVRKRMNAVPLASQAISVVTYAELMFGVRRSSNAKVNRTVVGAFLRHVSMLDWNRDAISASTHTPLSFTYLLELRSSLRSPPRKRIGTGRGGKMPGTI